MENLATTPPLASVSYAFLICAATLPLVEFAARRWHLFKIPGPLDLHSEPTPRLGGVSILLGLLVPLAISPTFLFREYRAFFAALLIVWLAGLADDVRRLLPLLRIVLQAVASVVVWWAGWRFPLGGGWVCTLFVTVFFVVLLINAMNMLDGADGLAGGVCLVIAFGFLLCFLHIGNSRGVTLAAALLGACLGFLLFNFPPAKIFMGDAGSHTLGFYIAFLSLEYYHRLPTPGFHWLVPVVFAAVPVLDLHFAVLRRLSKRTSPFTGDRQHFYDLLLQRGWSPRQVFFICALGTALLISLGWLLCRRDHAA